MSLELNKQVDREQYLKSAPLEDFLDEDPQINNQRFFILSYILPEKSNELQFPVIKVRGSYSTQEDCERRIEKLKGVDKYHNMFVCEVGKFGSLLPIEEIEKMDDVDIKYREAILNTMVQGYKENKDKKDAEFEERKEFLKKRAEYEGTIKGQQELKGVKENPIAVKVRIEDMTKNLTELTERLQQVQEILDISKNQLEKNYTEEEILEAQQKYEKEFPKKE